MVDLIYTDKRRKDIDILHGYELDLAYGSDENNFVLSLPLKRYDLEPGCYIYVEGTEYGGIIDAIGVSTPEKQVTYTGRTWHGILAGKVIAPQEGADYYLAGGDANQVIRDLIETAGLVDLFVVPEGDAGIYIDNYQIRYGNLYACLTDMLLQTDAKLKIEYRAGALYISAVGNVDYSESDDWDASQQDFRAEEDSRPINHLVCLGSGNLKDRHVIHLFADDAGEVQAYRTTEDPVQDSDYITDTSQQVFFGVDERAEVYDYPNAETTENYIALTAQPADWQTRCTRYYERHDEALEPVQLIKSMLYSVTTAEPSDWSTNPEHYYVYTEGKYRSVSKVNQTVYPVISSKPADWADKYMTYYYKSGSRYYHIQPAKETTRHEIKGSKMEKHEPKWKKNYAKYMTRRWDGVQWIYENVRPRIKETYTLQSKAPTDWKTNYRSYYKDKKGNRVEGDQYTVMENGKEVKKERAPKWKKKTFYTRYTSNVAPAIDKKATYYEDVTVEKAPAFNAQDVYGESITNRVAPTWEAGKYYFAQEVELVPAFVAGKFYELFLDHFAELVEKGLERMREYQNCDKISIDLVPTTPYDVGDLVGAHEEITGIYIKQPITKKIVKIGRKITINYEVGGNEYV